MRVRVVVVGVVLSCLVGLSYAAPAGAVVRRHWGLAVDSYGARLFVCRMPERTKLGVMWRHYVRVANHSRVRVQASVRVTRWIFRPSHNVAKDSWVRSVPSGGSTSVGSVRVWDQRASEGRFADFVAFKVVRPDGKVLQWQGLYPTGAPRCDLSPSAVSWQGTGGSSTLGRIQACTNMFLKSTGETARWRVRADATHATRPLTYHAFVESIGDGAVRQEWHRTFGPGGYSDPGVLSQPLERDPTTNYFMWGFTVGTSEVGEPLTGSRGPQPDNIC